MKLYIFRKNVFLALKSLKPFKVGSFIALRIKYTVQKRIYYQVICQPVLAGDAEKSHESGRYSIFVQKWELDNLLVGR